MNVDPVKKALFCLAATAILILFCGPGSAGAFDHEPVDRTMHLAQADRPEVDESVQLLELHFSLSPFMGVKYDKHPV